MTAYGLDNRGAHVLIANIIVQQKHLKTCHELSVNKYIVLCRIPSHIGITGNKMIEAEISLALNQAYFKTLFSKFLFKQQNYLGRRFGTCTSKIHLSPPSGIGCCLF